MRGSQGDWLNGLTGVVNAPVPMLLLIAAWLSGAELANLVNEAALLAARARAHEVAWDHFEKALDKLTLGLERRTAQLTEAERRPIYERSSLTRRALEGRPCTLLGGRAAEEHASRMMAQYGFCEALGPICYLRAEDRQGAGASDSGADRVEF